MACRQQLGECWSVAAGSAAGESCTELPATAAHALAHATILFGVLSALPAPRCTACSNPFSVHEVHVDAEQLAFFRQALAEAAGRPVVVFTHAPILGSGLKVVQTVHVKNRWGQRSRWLGRVGQAGAGWGRLGQAGAGWGLWISLPVFKGSACG